MAYLFLDDSESLSSESEDIDESYNRRILSTRRTIDKLRTEEKNAKFRFRVSLLLVISNVACVYVTYLLLTR